MLKFKKRIIAYIFENVRRTEIHIVYYNIRQGKEVGFFLARMMFAQIIIRV